MNVLNLNSGYKDNDSQIIKHAPDSYPDHNCSPLFSKLLF